MIKRFISNPGSPIKIIRSLKVFSDGSTRVVAVGQENIQLKIQSFESSCNINSLIARFASGDPSSINPVTPIYGDFTAFPRTIAEMQQKLIDGRKFFDSLPVEIKAKFDFDLNKFVAMSESPDFLDMLKISKNDVKLEEKVDSVVKEGASSES